MRSLIQAMLTVASLGLGIESTLGDVLPPGQTPSPYSVQLYLEGMERFPSVDFFIQPTNMVGDASRVTPQHNALGWYKFANPSLYAVRAPLQATPDPPDPLEQAKARGERPTPALFTALQRDAAARRASDNQAFRAALRLASCSECLKVSSSGEPAAEVRQIRVYLRVEALEGSALKVVPVREEHLDAKGALRSTLQR
jgi:hypothetical protein